LTICGRPTITTSPSSDSSWTDAMAASSAACEMPAAVVVFGGGQGLLEHRVDAAVDLRVHPADRQVAQGLRGLGEE
jgi:hypothetical protein